MLERPDRARRADRTTVLFQLGWPHFWLFSSILGGIVALVALVLIAHRLAL